MSNKDFEELLREIRAATLTDTLYNMHEHSGASDDYRKGVIVGFIGALMGAHDLTFEQAVIVACEKMPKSGTRLIVPDSWLALFCMQLHAHGKSYILPV
jgi:hypothetical protein